MVDVDMAMVDETLSRLVVLQAKEKPRVLHRNKRYVVRIKIDTIHVPVFSALCLRCSSLAINAFVSSATLRVQYCINGENVF